MLCSRDRVFISLRTTLLSTVCASPVPVCRRRVTGRFQVLLGSLIPGVRGSRSRKPQCGLMPRRGCFPRGFLFFGTPVIGVHRRAPCPMYDGAKTPAGMVGIVIYDPEAPSTGGGTPLAYVRSAVCAVGPLGDGCGCARGGGSRSERL